MKDERIVASQFEAGDGPEDEIKALVNYVPLYMEIASQKDLDMASAFLLKVREVKVRIEGIFRPQIRKAHDLWKGLLAEEAKLTGKIDDMDRKVREAVAAYVTEQDRIRFKAEQEAVLAKKKAEKVAEAALDKAHEMVEDGRVGAAELVMEKAKEKVEQILTAAQAVPDKPVHDGVSVKKIWTFEIVNPDKVPAKFKKPDLVAIGDFVSHFKDQAQRHLPGVRVFTKDVVAVKAGK